MTTQKLHKLAFQHNKLQHLWLLFIESLQNGLFFRFWTMGLALPLG